MQTDPSREHPKSESSDLPDPGAFYLPEDDGFASTVLTRGPWDLDFQHGGPPSALLTTALLEGVEGMSLARITLEFLRPVPITTLHVEIEEVTEGRTVRRRRAQLFASERPVLEARALFIRDQPIDGETFGDPWPNRDSQSPFTFPFFPWKEGYHQAVDIRVLDPPWGKTPMRCWGRARVPLIAGKPTLPEAHTLILADAESGMGPPSTPWNGLTSTPTSRCISAVDRNPAGWVSTSAPSLEIPVVG